MATIFAAATFAVFLALTFVAWRRYLWAAEKAARAGGHLPVQPDGCLWRPPPRERTAPGRSPVAHRGLQPLRREVPASHGLADSPHRRVADLRRARRASGKRGRGPFSLPHRPGPGRGRGHVAGQLANRGRSPRHSQGRRYRDVPRHHLARRPDHPHARRRTAGGHSHARAGQVPRPADARRPDVAARGCPEESRRPGWTTPRSALRPSFTRAEPPGCPRAWSARTPAT